jgi:hypothetical protein
LQTVLGGRIMPELPSNTSKKGVPTPARVVRDMASTYGYEDVLTQRERDFIALRTHELCARLGYAEAPRAGRLRMLREWVLPDRWERMNVTSRVGWLRAMVRRRAYVYGRLIRG